MTSLYKTKPRTYGTTTKSRPSSPVKRLSPSGRIDNDNNSKTKSASSSKTARIDVDNDSDGDDEGDEKEAQSSRLLDSHFRSPSSDESITTNHVSNVAKGKTVQRVQKNVKSSEHDHVVHEMIEVEGGSINKLLKAKKGEIKGQKKITGISKILSSGAYNTSTHGVKDLVDDIQPSSTTKSRHSKRILEVEIPNSANKKLKTTEHDFEPDSDLDLNELLLSPRKPRIDDPSSHRKPESKTVVESDQMDIDPPTPNLLSSDPIALNDDDDIEQQNASQKIPDPRMIAKGGAGTKSQAAQAVSKSEGKKRDHEIDSSHTNKSESPSKNKFSPQKHRTPQTVAITKHDDETIPHPEHSAPPLNLDKSLVIRIILAKLEASKTCDWYQLGLDVAKLDANAVTKSKIGGATTKKRGGKKKKDVDVDDEDFDKMKVGKVLGGVELRDMYYKQILPALKSGQALWIEDSPSNDVISRDDKDEAVTVVRIDQELKTPARSKDHTPSTVRRTRKLGSTPMSDILQTPSDGHITLISEFNPGAEDDDIIPSGIFKMPGMKSKAHSKPTQSNLKNTKSQEQSNARKHNALHSEDVFGQQDENGSDRDSDYDLEPPRKKIKTSAGVTKKLNDEEELVAFADAADGNERKLPSRASRGAKIAAGKPTRAAAI